MSYTIEWDAYFDCYRINGILSPQPLRYVPPKPDSPFWVFWERAQQTQQFYPCPPRPVPPSDPTPQAHTQPFYPFASSSVPPSEPTPQTQTQPFYPFASSSVPPSDPTPQPQTQPFYPFPENPVPPSEPTQRPHSPSPRPENPPVAQEPQQWSSGRPPKRRQRELKTSVVDENKSILFRLLRSTQDTKYYLEMREVATGIKTTFSLDAFFDNKGNPKIKASKNNLNALEEWNTITVTEEPNPEIEKKYNMPLKERVEGQWSVEIRKRNDTSGRSDNFYVHAKLKNFRSMNEAATFIVLGR